MQKPVYFDHLATTPVDPLVLDAMLPYFREKFGNAASRAHAFGWAAEKAVDQARQRVAELCGSTPREIVFTSGATESNNLAIKGAMEAYRSRGNHIVTLATEHHAVLDPVKRLSGEGFSVTLLPPRPGGLLDLDRLRDVIRPETVLVSVLFANNEIGTIQPVREIGTICRGRGVLFHTDAAQAFGKLPIRVTDDGIDLMSISAHKIYGPKGVGALYVRRGLTLTAQMDGGGQERGFRSGTLNVPGIVGLGEAALLCAQHMTQETERVRALRDRLWTQITAGLADVSVNGSMESRLAGNLNVHFSGVDANALLAALPDVAISTGSACSSASPEPSHVLRAIGLTDQAARSSVRFGLGRTNTEEEVAYVAARLIQTVRKLRGALVCP